MALKKGFCSHCKGDERLRIFDVNSAAEVCYCPNCMAEMLPKEAIMNYGYLISHYLKKASKALFEKAGYQNIEVITHEHMRHEILNELENEKVYKDLLEFFKK